MRAGASEWACACVHGEKIDAKCTIKVFDEQRIAGNAHQKMLNEQRIAGNAR